MNQKDNFSEEFLKSALFQLIESKILIQIDTVEHKQEGQLELWDTWGSSSKYFHYNFRLLHKDHYMNKNEQYKRLSIKRKKESPPNIYKSIDSSEKVKLPNPSFNNEKGFLETLLERQTIRSFNDESVSLNDFLPYYI
ncbi:hypothetical protein [Viridibacillus soli]|uniref:hypothetical protein n=1 Tax=Viridibacillus soli TaxID=2798301 RepID=UPI001F40E9AE|nr:hypothetical protein [Viridibacillus soli]